MIARIIFTLAIGLSSQGFAETAGKFAKEHEAFVSSIKYLQVDFDQEIYKAFRKKTTKRKGSALFSQPGYFAWKFVDPKYGEEEYYFNGTRLSRYLKKENAVTHYGTLANFTNELQQVVNLVLDPGKLLKSYDSLVLAKDKEKINYMLTPLKDQGAGIEHIKVTYSFKEKYISMVAILYKEGNQAKYFFKNPVQKKPALDSFKFKNPGGVKESSVG